MASRRPGAPALVLAVLVLLVSGSPVTPAAGRSHLPDVRTVDPDHRAISWAVEGGILGLDARGRFRPGAPLTRGVAVRAVWRTAGAPRGYPSHGLGDVPREIESAVRWAVAEGVDVGSGGRFRPGNPVTRGRVLRWLWRAEGAPTRSPAPDGSLVALAPSGLGRAPAGPSAWAVAARVLSSRDRPFRDGEVLRRTDAARWLFRWNRVAPAELTGRNEDTNRVTLWWRVRPTLAAEPLAVDLELGLRHEPELLDLPTGCGADGWCARSLRVEQAGVLRFTLSARAGSAPLHQVATEVEVAPLPRPVVADPRVVVDVTDPGPQVLAWSAPPGVDPAAPSATDLVQVIRPRELVPSGGDRPLSGELVLPEARWATSEPQTWLLRYCRRPDGGTAVLDGVLCSPGVAVTFDPEGAQFAGDVAGGGRRFHDVGDDVTVSWSGPGVEWALVAPTLLGEPLHTSGRAHTFADLPEGVHGVELVTCAGPCPADLTGLVRERLQLVVGLDGQRPVWTSEPIDGGHSVQVIDTSTRPTVGSPLDVTIDPDGDAWLVGEFGADLARIPGAGGTAEVSHLEVPLVRAADGAPVGAFANPFHDETSGPSCRSTTISALGERVVATPSGTWFTQGGALGPLAPCVGENHSRLVRFDRSARDDPRTRGDDRFCVVTVPGVNAQVVGVAHDTGSGRLWFAEPGGTDGPALSWFDEDEAPCRNDLDHGDAAAVADAAAEDRCPHGAAPAGCIHRLPLGPDVAPAHLAVDPATDSLWVTDFGGRVLLRVPRDATGAHEVERYPMPTGLGGLWNGFPWQLRVADDAVYVIEYSDNQIVRFDTTVADRQVACATLVLGANPCMQEVFLPAPTDTVNAHSLALDDDRLWFTQANEANGVEDPAAGRIGYLDLSTWTATDPPTGVLLDGLGDLGPLPAGDHPSPRGIEVDPTSGRVVVADMAQAVLVLTPG